MNSDPKQRQAEQGAVAPALFVSHGSPMVALQEDDFTRALRGFGEGCSPLSAVVVVSAHWETRGAVRVTAAESPPLIHDFGGFSSRLFELTYPGPGAPALAAEVAALLTAAGVPAAVDATRGWDHGTWIPLRLLLPQARTPVLQLSLPWGASAADVARMGEALRALRQKGVLLMGSGGITHNLRQLDWHDKHGPAADWAGAFDAWIARGLAARDFVGLQSWRDAPHAPLAHPSAEHLLPLFFVLGAALPEDRIMDVFEGFHHTTLSMRSFALRG